MVQNVALTMHRTRHLLRSALLLPLTLAAWAQKSWSALFASQRSAGGSGPQGPAGDAGSRGRIWEVVWRE
jgi:hypothetical protein